MKVFRLAKNKYAKTLSGFGAAKFGNRWNSKGTEIIYTAESRALAMAEVIVHVTLATLPSDFMMVEIEIPDDILIKKIDTNELPEYWNQHPHIVATQKIGDDFIFDNTFCILQVPSAVVEGDFNYLINPHHADFKKISIITYKPFPFDTRIFK